VDLLFGLDMLKAHQACIDLERNVLRIQGREVGFLPEHELPAQARQLEVPEATTSTPSTSGNRSEGASGSRSGGTSSFPGSGRPLGSVPGGTSAPPSNPAPPNAHPEEAVATLMGLGASREQAIQLLSAAGGNIDVAASLLFQ
jgi:DNA damage-inducible protein 1